MELYKNVYIYIYSIFNEKQTAKKYADRVSETN